MKIKLSQLYTRKNIYPDKFKVFIATRQVIHMYSTLCQYLNKCDGWFCLGKPFLEEVTSSILDS